MKTKIQLMFQILLAVACIVLLGVSISGRLQSKWPLCGAIGCTIAVNVMNIIRIKERQRKEKDGSVKNWKFH